ncbi:MAG TPA: DUF2279 domain-containing protein [Bacteroidia bacterium]|jgi:hypothetical protein|nr:DUF2279 domain-containing protein [Bacteroidia bacterium]
MFSNSHHKKLIISLFFLFLINISLAQKLPADSLTSKQKLIRKSLLLGSMTAYTVGSLTLLDLIWYQPYQTTSFHFFNDNAQWCQMDKCGHGFSAYSSARLITQSMEWAGFETSAFKTGLGHLSTGALKWAGFSRKQSIFIGQAFGLLYLSSVEIMDGFSKEWGFSWGDEVANFAGGFAFSLQQYYWKEQRIQLKFSYHQTSFPAYRPNILGNNSVEQIIKDYNGQTYWLSINIASFLKKEAKFPKWLNVAFGYGATNMISGKNNLIIYPDGTTATNPVNNQTEIIDKNGQTNFFYRYRKYYFSLDIDLTKIKTKSRFLKSVFSAFNCFKLSFPSIEFDKYGTHFKPFYF